MAESLTDSARSSAAMSPVPSTVAHSYESARSTSVINQDSDRPDSQRRRAEWWSFWLPEGREDRGRKLSLFAQAAVSFIFPNLWPLLIWVLTLIIFAISNVMLPGLVTIQMYSLDSLIHEYCVNSLKWLWILVLVDVFLILHLLLQIGSLEVALSGSLQWIIYSWLLAVKCILIYMSILPALQFEQAQLTQTARTVAIWLYIMPIFYCILTFRTIRTLARQDRRQGVWRDRKRTSERSASQAPQESITLDMVLLQDMIWHVCLDLLDISTMIFWSYPDNPQDYQAMLIVYDQLPGQYYSVGASAGTFIFLALFFHQQSFPIIGHLVSDQLGGMERPRSLAPARKSAGKSDEEPSASSWVRKYRVDVVKARKRSAIVSILFVDLPFFIIRTYIYIMLLNSHTLLELATKVTGQNGTMTLANAVDVNAIAKARPSLDKWWVKNILCLILQALQLRLVQQADLEQSQSLRWWDTLRKGSFDVADVGVTATARRHVATHDLHLLKAWKDMDRQRLDAALEDTGGLESTPMSPQSSAMSPERSGIEETSTAEGRKRRRKLSMLWRFCFPCRICRRFCCCCCWCCRCSVNFNMFMLFQIVMGLCLGWFLAKVDFNQDYSTTLSGMLATSA